MAKKVKGVVAQFGTKGYGFINGDDGEKYFVHQKNIFNKSRLRTNTRVIFNAQESEKGLVATDVELEEGGSLFSASSDGSTGSTGWIKAALAILFIVQIALVYKVFFSATSG
jgi:CspA family cold shock protein